MFKKFLALLLAVLLLFSLAACTKEVPVKTPSDVSSSESEPQISPYIVNPLTGIEDLPREKNNLRPVAIMIDNDSNAQRYAQSGISEADIVYETETEGGITDKNLLAANPTLKPVFHDTSYFFHITIKLFINYRRMSIKIQNLFHFFKSLNTPNRNNIFILL